MSKDNELFRFSLPFLNITNLVVISSFILLYGVKTSSAQGLSVSASETEGIIQKDGKGIYNPILDYLSKLELVSTLNISNPRRARRDFLDGKSDCLFPASERILPELFLNSNDVIFTEPVTISRGYVVFHNTKNPPELTKDLKLGTVGIAELYGYKNVSIINIKSYNDLMNLVETGRLEAGYIMYPDVSQVKGMNKRILPFLPSALKIWEETDALLCRKEKQVMVSQISVKLKALKNDGILLDGHFKQLPLK